MYSITEEDSMLTLENNNLIDPNQFNLDNEKTTSNDQKNKINVFGSQPFEKPSRKIFEMDIMDLKISHSKFSKRFFREAFKEQDFKTEMSKFTVLEKILNYK
jgi:hypothetical protein